MGQESYKQKKRKDCFGQDHLPCGGVGSAGRLIICRLPHLPLGDGEGPVAKGLIGADQKVPDGEG